MPLTTVNPGLLDTQAQYTGFKNRIFNGQMQIDQRNAGASVTLTDGIYNLDRFQGSVSQTNKITVQRSSTAPAGFINSQILTVSSTMTIGAGDYCGNAQSIEGFNTSDLGFGTANAQSVTVSFWARSSITGTYSVALHNSAFDRTNAKAYTINSANTWEYKTITFAGDTSGTWLTNNGVGIKVYFALSMGSTYGGGTDGVWSSTPKLAVTGQTQWATNSGATFYITGVQLEKGSTATSFDYRPYGTELALCQRYFYKMTSSGATTNYYALCLEGANNGAGSAGSFPVTMRTQPSIVIGSGVRVFFPSTSAQTPILNSNRCSTTSASLVVTWVGTAGTVGQAGSLYDGAANSFFDYSAEL
jgi:hypothetical protein